MHANLLGLTQNIKRQADSLGMSISVATTLDNGSIILSNSDSGKVALLGMVEISGTWITAAYSVDPYKWQWAEEEGFTKDEIMNDVELSAEIFKELRVDKIVEHLL